LSLLRVDFLGAVCKFSFYFTYLFTDFVIIISSTEFYKTFFDYFIRDAFELSKRVFYFARSYSRSRYALSWILTWSWWSQLFGWFAWRSCSWYKYVDCVRNGQMVRERNPQ